jgi:hypothetical protein
MKYRPKNSRSYIEVFRFKVAWDGNEEEDWLLWQQMDDWIVPAAELIGVEATLDHLHASPSIWKLGVFRPPAHQLPCGFFVAACHDFLLQKKHPLPGRPCGGS